MQKATLEGWFIDILPDLNQDDPEIARYVIQNTLWWIGVTGLDGIRQDTLPYVHRRFWRDWMAAIKKEYPRLTVVGELFDGDPALVSFFQGGEARFDGIDSGVDTLFDFPLYYTIREAFAQRRLAARRRARCSRATTCTATRRVLVTFLGLHDVPRFMNEPGATPRRRCAAAFTFLLTARGTPLVYYGDEIAMPGGGDPDNRRDFPGGFPGDARSAFEAAGRTPDEEAVHAHVRRAPAAARRDAGAATRRARATCTSPTSRGSTPVYSRAPARRWWRSTPATGRNRWTSTPWRPASRPARGSRTGSARGSRRPSTAAGSA